METLSKQQQQQQAAQAEQQAKVDNSKVMASFTKSKVDLAKEQELRASAQEKYAKIDQDHAQAEYLRAESDLNLVRLAMELEDVQFNQIKNAFELAQSIKIANQPQAI